MNEEKRCVYKTYRSINPWMNEIMINFLRLIILELYAKKFLYLCFTPRIEMNKQNEMNIRMEAN